MKKLIWLTTILVFSIIFLAPALMALGIKLVPGGDQPGYNSNERLSIYSERTVTQKFTSNNNNFSAIGTSIRNPNLKNKKEIIFNLYNEKMEKIRNVTVNGQNVEDGNFIKFIFAPIIDSAGKTYFFSLGTPDAGPEETIEVFVSQNMPVWIEQYVYDGKSYRGGIPIVLYFKPVSKTTVIKSIYSDLFSRLLFQNFRKP